METSLKTGFAQIFSCCPKNLSCPKSGGAAAPLAPPARTPMLKAPLDNNLAFIATACCEQQGLTQELKLTSIGSPGFPSSICPSSLRVMCRVSSFPEFENRLSRLPVLSLDASLLKRTLQVCAMNLSFQVSSLVCGGP